MSHFTQDKSDIDIDQCLPSLITATDRIDTEPELPSFSFVKALLLMAIGIILIHLAFLKPVTWGIDGNEVLRVAHSLVTRQSFGISPNADGMLGWDGQSYSTRYLLLPILLMPLVAIAVGLSHWIDLPTLQIAGTFAVISSVTFTAATSMLVALLAFRLGSTRSSAYIAALCYSFGTIALTYAQTLFSEPLLAFLTIACVYLAFGESQWEWFGCSMIATLAILAKPSGIVIAPIISLYFLVKRYAFWTVLGPVFMPFLGVVGYGLYNYRRFGNLWETGQPIHYAWTSVGMSERFFGFLFGLGMGGGLIWYCPPVVLAVVGFYKIFRRRPLEALTIVSIGLSFLLLHSHWWCCGWDWGPRFLVPLLPLLMASTALLDYRSRWWLILLSAVGFLISVPTLVSFYQRYYWEIDTAGRDIWALSLWTSLADSPLYNAWGAAYRQISEALTTDVHDVLAEGELIGLTKIVPVWWWMLPIVGIPVWLGAIVAIGLVVAGIASIRQGWQRLVG